MNQYSGKERFAIWVLLCTVLILGSCKDPDAPPADPPAIPHVDGFPPVRHPQDNPYSQEKALLGKHLFYDKSLSIDNSVSCGSCHQQEFAFSDAGNATSKGFHGLTGTRNAPGLTNVTYNTSFFWDGGVPTLEQQAIAPIINPIEMNMNSDTLVARLKMIPKYQELFTKAWGTSEITFDRVTKSIACFERTLLSGNSAYDRYKRGDTSAISTQAKFGSILFFSEKADCFHCHGGFNFTDNAFHNTGLDSIAVDKGLYLVSAYDPDKGKFRTPSLRNIALTAPYMHDGRFMTLEEALGHYNSGGRGAPFKDALVRPLNLSKEEVDAIIAFLKSLTDDEFVNNTEFKEPN